MPREFLAANNDGIDSHLKGTFSHFVGKVPVKTRVQHREWRTYDAENNVSAGGQGIYTPPRAFDIWGRTVLQFTVTAVTPSAGTAELQDFVACRAINYVQVMWGGNELQRITGDDIFKHWFLHKTTDNSYTGLMRGDLSQAARQTLAASNTTVYLPLPLLWCGHPKSYLPYNQQATRQNIRIIVHYNAKDQYVATPGGTISSGGDLSDTKLWVEQFHIGNNELKAILQEKKSKNAVLGTLGYTRAVTTYEGQSGEALAASTAEQTIKLSSLRRPAKALMFTVVNSSDRVSGEGNTPNHYNFQAISSYRLVSSGRDVAISRPHDFAINYETNSSYSAAPTKNIYVLPWSMLPQAWGDQHGYLNLGGLGSASLAVTLASATAGILDITEIAHNLYTLSPTGDYRVLYV